MSKTKPLTVVEIIACVKHAETAMDTALVRRDGVRLDFPIERTARAFRSKCQGRINRSRRRSERITDPLDPTWSTTPWDDLSFYIAPLDKGGWSLHIRIDTPEMLGITGSN